MTPRTRAHHPMSSAAAETQTQTRSSTVALSLTRSSAGETQTQTRNSTVVVAVEVESSSHPMVAGCCRHYQTVEARSRAARGC